MCLRCGISERCCRGKTRWQQSEEDVILLTHFNGSPAVISLRPAHVNDFVNEFERTLWWDGFWQGWTLREPGAKSQTRIGLPMIVTNIERENRRNVKLPPSIGK